jgi:hypothetical protein
MLEAVVYRAFDMFNRRDLDGLLELLHSDVRVHSLMTEAEREDYFGHDGCASGTPPCSRSSPIGARWSGRSVTWAAAPRSSRTEEDAREALGLGSSKPRE